MAASLIGRQLPVPDVPSLTPKLQYLSEHRDNFDTLFIGSSRIYHQVLPSVFDEKMQALGVATKSFNLGIAGMRPPEDSYVFDQVRKMKPRNLRWVFIEAGGLRFPIDRDKKGTVRAVYWHDFERTLLLLRFAPSHQSDWNIDKLLDTSRIVGDHLALFARQFSNIGRAGVITSRLVTNKKQKIHLRALGEKLDGFRATGQPEEIREVERIQLEKELAALRVEPSEIRYDKKISQVAVDRLFRRIRAMGAEPVLVIPPTTSGSRFYPAPWIQPQPLVLDYSDIDQYPELFEPRHRLDHAHLNLAGGKVFTEYLARDFAAALRARQ
ncbi:MAG TPA: hypothetical protein VF614_10060 [Chthoniobacteraceae bacterium]